MSIKQKITNWRTNQMIANDERKAERQEIKEAVKLAKLEAQAQRRHEDFEIRKAKAIEFAKSGGYAGRMKRNIGAVVKGVGSSASRPKGKGKSKLEGFLSGFDMGGSQLTLDVGTPTFDFGVGGGSRRKGKKRKQEGLTLW